MHSRAVIVFLISAIMICSGEEQSAVAQAKRLHGRKFPRMVISARTPRTLCNIEEVECKDDMFTFCGIGGVKKTVKCSDIMDGKPGFCDCDNAYCLPERPKCFKPECDLEGEKLPDPLECRNFTFCDGKKKNIYQCPQGFTYNPRKKICDFNSGCYKLSCNSKKPIELIPFPQSPEYYLFCSYGASEVRTCKQPEYGMENGKCQYQCTKPGLFRDPKSDKCRDGYWYSCIQQKGNTFFKQTLRCPKDENGKQLFFDEKHGICTQTDTCGNSDSKEPDQAPPASPPATGQSIVKN
ncbi:UNVERIFIED_CONTAM: hypothetical protein PYX00_007018 [Menopon gallinae]|uniref:Chitin-binding type-2 domain-containing protein n=1 Tax=Menopon gallinae TaxID=328185 RepID=A0AAW2HI41_9NEOP